MIIIYPEFIAIYVGIGILVVLQILTIILVIIMGKKSRRRNNQNTMDEVFSAGNGHRPTKGIAFCTNCGTQFDAALKVCPKCGRAR